MGRYSREPDNPTKSCKARGSNLRVHFKVRCGCFLLFTALVLKSVNFDRTRGKPPTPSSACLWGEPSLSSRMSSRRQSVFLSAASTEVSADALRSVDCPFMPNSYYLYDYNLKHSRQLADRLQCFKTDLTLLWQTFLTCGLWDQC